MEAGCVVRVRTAGWPLLEQAASDTRRALATRTGFDALTVDKIPTRVPAAPSSEELERGGRFWPGNGSAVAGVEDEAADRDVECRVECNHPAVRLLLAADVSRAGLGVNR
jgi:hypothetical protein